MNLTDHMIDSTTELPYNLHILLGFAVGILTSAITEHLGDVFVTFLLGGSSALGAGLVKFLLERLKRIKKKEKDQDDRDADQNSRETDQNSRTTRQNTREADQNKREEKGTKNI